MRELTHEVSTRGEGNVCSLEFNLLYRWHAALSKADTAWTESLFEGVFGKVDYSTVSTSFISESPLLKKELFLDHTRRVPQDTQNQPKVKT